MVSAVLKPVIVSLPLVWRDSIAFAVIVAAYALAPVIDQRTDELDGTAISSTRCTLGNSDGLSEASAILLFARR